jgi:hypothetical protein
LDDAFSGVNRIKRRVLGAKSSEIPGEFNGRAQKSLNFPGDSARAQTTGLDNG